MSEPLPILVVDESGGQHMFAASICEELVRMEVMWIDESGKHHIRSADRDIASLNPHIAVCDVCTGQPVTWDADVRDFRSFDPSAGPFSDFRSVDGYFLCEPCGQLVIAGDRVTLLRRQVRESMRRHFSEMQLEERANQVALLHRVCGPVHELFWRNLRGIKRIEK